MEDFVAALQVFYRAVGENLPHAVHEVFPVFCAVEVIHHEEAAFLQVLAQPLGLGIGECPVLRLDGIDPGIVEDLVIVQADNLLIRSTVNAGEPMHGNEELAVGFWIIARPGTAAEASTASSTAPKTGHIGVVSQARPVELRLGVGGGVVLAKAETGNPLKGPQTGSAHGQRHGDESDPGKPHP